MTKKFSIKNLDKGVAYLLAILAFIMGWIVTLYGLMTPPKGVIDNSVLIVLGQALSFSGGVLGITHHVSSSLDKFKMEIDNRPEKPKE